MVRATLQRIIPLFVYFLVHCTSADREVETPCLYDEPLGMISGKIKNWQISSSSTYPSNWASNCEEHNARLYLKNKVSWCAKYKSTSEWLQVDLGVKATITGVLTQGRADGKEWVTEFLLSYSDDAINWEYVTDQYGNQKIFEGNVDAYSVKHNYLDRPIHARFIKWHTQKWNAHPSMRVEVHGCQTCRHLLGVPPYAKISASSSRGMRSKRSCTPEYGHVLSNKAWCAKNSNRKQFLQFDVGPPTRITGLVVKGRGDGRKRHWVTSFKISHSNDSRVWEYYKDEAYLDPKKMYIWRDTQSNSLAANTDDGLIFAGNNDKNTERVHFLTKPFVARYVRFHPITWRGRLSMRAGLYGCPHVGDCGKGYFRINKNSKCVPNLAYNKEAWISSPTTRVNKRETLEGKPDVEAKKAVDGNLDDRLHSCAILSNINFNSRLVPAWVVNLNKPAIVSGVRIHTWQGKGQSVRLSYTDYFSSLDRIAVFVTNRERRVDIVDSQHLCGMTTRLNNALFRKVIHIQCNQPLEGKYVYIEAFGVANRWDVRYNAVLCEVEVY